MLIAGVFHEDFANAFDKPGSIVDVSEIHDIKLLLPFKVHVTEIT